MTKYLFVTKKGRVIVKNFKSEKQAYEYRMKNLANTDIEIWGKTVADWLAKYKLKWLDNALIKLDGKYIK